MLDEGKRLQMLTRPSGAVDVLLDSDMFNEIDDQYALAYLLQSSDKLKLKGILAAPFANHHAKNAKEGMEKSEREIYHILQLMGREELNGIVYSGAMSFLPDEQTPVDSPAAQKIVQEAMQHTPENPLYVIGIAAATNLASALLLEPAIIDRTVMVWLGGRSFDWPDNRSFNARQDVAAARVLLGCGVPVVLLPGHGVVDHFTTTGPELRYWLGGKNSFCDYMVEKTEQEAMLKGQGKCWSRAIWDVTAVAWLLDEAFMSDRLEHSPIMEYDHHYSFDHTRHFIRYVYHIHRDALMEDMFAKLSTL